MSLEFDREARPLFVQTCVWIIALIMWVDAHFGETELAVPVGVHLLGLAASLRALQVRKSPSKLRKTQYAFVVASTASFFVWIAFLLLHGGRPIGAFALVSTLIVTAMTAGTGAVLARTFRAAELEAEQSAISETQPAL